MMRTKKVMLLALGLFCFLFVGCAVAENASMTLEKGVYAPGESISVTFTAPASFASNAWVGIIPSHVMHGSESENDKHDLSYQYLKQRTSGVLTFAAPSAPGNYDFRMHDTDNGGREVTSVSFTVQGEVSSNASLQLPKGVYAPGESISVTFTAPASFASNAWVGIIPSHVMHGSEPENDKHDLSYQYLKQRTSGVLTFAAPSAPGNYDFLMHDTDNGGKEVTSVSFTVAN